MLLLRTMGLKRPTSNSRLVRQSQTGRIPHCSLVRVMKHRLAVQLTNGVGACITQPPNAEMCLGEAVRIDGSGVAAGVERPPRPRRAWRVAATLLTIAAVVAMPHAGAMSLDEFRDPQDGKV